MTQSPSEISPITSIQDIQKPLERHFGHLEEFLDGELRHFEPEVRDLVSYTFRHKGKQLRPMLVFFSGMRDERGEVNEDLVKIAAVMELVHLATLVHDDILDEATLRHKEKTVQVKYGSRAAVLLGDALFSHALHLASEFPSVDVCRQVSEAVRRVCCGEIAQTLRDPNSEKSLQKYFRIIDLKTAELFRVSAKLGAQKSGGSDDYVSAVEGFGRNFGMAYQIYDDLMDFLGDEDHIGKTLGTDLKTGKWTLPLLLYYNNLSEVNKKEFQLRIDKGDMSRAQLKETLEAQGIIDLVRSDIKEKLREGAQRISIFSETKGIGHLLKLNEFMINKLGN